MKAQTREVFAEKSDKTSMSASHFNLSKILRATTSPSADTTWSNLTQSELRRAQKMVVAKLQCPTDIVSELSQDPRQKDLDCVNAVSNMRLCDKGFEDEQDVGGPRGLP